MYVDFKLWFDSASEDGDEPQSPIVKLELVDAVDVFSSGSSFTVAGKGYCARVIKAQTITHTEMLLHPELDPVQVVSRSRGRTTLYLVVNNDGRLLVGIKHSNVPFSDVKLVEVNNIPRISRIEVIKGKSQIVDVDNGTWTMADDGTVIKDNRPLFPRGRDELRKWLADHPESNLEGVKDIYGSIQEVEHFMCEGDGSLLLVKEDGKVETVTVTGLEDGEYYYRQEEYPYFSF